MGAGARSRPTVLAQTPLRQKCYVVTCYINLLYETSFVTDCFEYETQFLKEAKHFKRILRTRSKPVMYVCMHVCPKISIRRALNKVTDAPRSQINKNVFNARLRRSVNRSTERKEVGRLFQILDPATAKLRSSNVLLVRGTTNVAVTDDRSVHRLESAMSWQSSAR